VYLSRRPQETEGALLVRAHAQTPDTYYSI
jgi:hypothetical protein